MTFHAPALAAAAVGVAYLAAAIVQADRVAWMVVVGPILVGCGAQVAGHIGMALSWRLFGQRVPAWPSRLLAMLCVYLFLLPPLDLRWAFGIGGHTAGITSLWATGIHGLCSFALSRRDDGVGRSREAATAGAAILMVMGAAAPGSIVRYASPAAIERFLVSRTPLGSPQGVVLASLDDAGIASQPVHTRVNGGLYPPAALGGATRLQVLVGEHGPIFVTSVEAYYYFDDAGRLVELRVSKTVDSL